MTTSRDHKSNTAAVWHSLVSILLAMTVAACAEEPAPAQSESTSESPPSFQIPEVPSDSGTGATGLRWTVPENWVEERPSSSMRRAQYRLPGNADSEDAEVVVFYFGPGQGGGVEANAQRWASQFTAPGGGPSQDVEMRQLEANGLPMLRVEVRGTYDGGMRMGAPGPSSFPGYMLLGAIVAGPDSNWFFKLTGPEATVTEHASGFDALLESLEQGQ